MSASPDPAPVVLPMPLASRLVAGGGLVIAGLTHLWLWWHGYRDATVGPWFLGEAGVSSAVGVWVLVRGSRWSSWTASAVAGAALGAYALARTVGLFGFQERLLNHTSLLAAVCEAVVVVLGVTEGLAATVPPTAEAPNQRPYQRPNQPPYQLPYQPSGEPDGKLGPMTTADRAPTPDELVVWFNPSCSKCRGARDILEERGQPATLVEYLHDAPSREELERVLGLLGTDDPSVITRTDEARYRELGLDGAERETLLDALAANPILIQRPIAIRGQRAVIARPPERLLDLLDLDPTEDGGT